MKKILNVIAYETGKTNENGFFDTEIIVYSVYYTDGEIEEIYNENSENIEDILDFIDYAKVNETWHINSNGTEQREMLYFSVS